VVSEGGTRKRVRRPGTKRVTGKEGSPREEEWLVTTMRGLVPSDKLLCTCLHPLSSLSLSSPLPSSSSSLTFCLHSATADLKELLDTLVLFGHMTEAKELHAALAALVELVNSTADMLDDSECLYVQRRRARAARKVRIISSSSLHHGVRHHGSLSHRALIPSSSSSG
jgi:hypothetical protein